MKYKRVLLKLSGEALMGNQQYGIDPQRLDDYAEEIANAVREGAQIAIVIGGGNIFRGLQGASKGIDRVQGDSMGMLATVINSIAIQSTLQAKGIKTVLLSGLYIDKIAETMSGPKAIEYLENGYVVVIGGGTGNPYFTTDTGSALRAIEIKADIILKGTRVDGIYTADPEKDPSATKYESITYDEAYNKNLKVMDLTAFTMCKENNMPMLVFDMNTKGNLTKVLSGENIGTLVTK
ncbi:MAG: UMP kinase [Candidatus Limimorpha sp.]|nr:UMP kinase [Bacteroidales bacterium]MCI7377162.1 UMP kinase [Bacteroidales bacterium]MDD5978223.1 UMP kinase [Bacteroidales bacterium]MDY6075655.1 UMP kinase [Bacteroidales bacterium]